MVAKKGAVKAHHFAHFTNAACDEWYGNKGDWHIEMQNLFPKENQEVILEVDGEKHIADVCIEKPCGQRLVIEFQDSPISYKEFIRRTKFWKDNNSDVIWVFNLLDKDIREVPNGYTNGLYRYQWYRAFSTLGEEMFPGITVFFYINPVTKTYFLNSEGYDGKPRWTIRGNHHGEPFLLQLESVGHYIPDAIDIDDEYFEYYVKGYSGITGKKCYDFKKFIDERIKSKYEDPTDYNGQLWIRFNDLDSFYSDKFINHIQTLQRKALNKSITVYIYIREEKKSRLITVYYPDRIELVKKLYIIYGKDNIRIAKNK